MLFHHVGLSKGFSGGERWLDEQDIGFSVADLPLSGRQSLDPGYDVMEGEDRRGLLVKMNLPIDTGGH